MYPVVKISRRNTTMHVRNVALVTSGISLIHTNALVRKLAFDVTLFPTPCIFALTQKKKMRGKKEEQKNKKE